MAVGARRRANFPNAMLENCLQLTKVFKKNVSKNPKKRRKHRISTEDF